MGVNKYMCFLFKDVMKVRKELIKRRGGLKGKSNYVSDDCDPYELEVATRKRIAEHLNSLHNNDLLRKEIVDILDECGCCPKENLDGYNILRAENDLYKRGVTVKLSWFHPEQRCFEYVLNYKEVKFLVRVYTDCLMLDFL